MNTDVVLIAISCFLLGAILVMIRHSRQAHQRYLARLAQINLNDPADVQRAFQELAMHVHPFLFCTVIPLAILMDFIPHVIWRSLHGAGKFDRRPLSALLGRVEFFNALLSARIGTRGWDSVGTQTFQHVIRMHAAHGLDVPFGREDLIRHQVSVLGWVLWAAETLAPRFAYRPLLAIESEVIFRWLAELAVQLGVKDFAFSPEALREGLLIYGRDEHIHPQNRPNESRNMLNSLLLGIGGLLPWPFSRFLSRWLERVLFAIAPDSVLYGFQAQHRRLPLSARLLGWIASAWGVLFPYRQKPFSFGLVVNLLRHGAEKEGVSE